MSEFINRDWRTTKESKDVERVARAVREEIVRQYREDERGKCPSGTQFYEESIGPAKIALAAIEEIRYPTDAMLNRVKSSLENFEAGWLLEKGSVNPSDDDYIKAKASWIWRVMIHIILKG